MTESENDENRLKLGVTSVEDHATIFTIHGSKFQSVKISCEVEDRKLWWTYSRDSSAISIMKEDQTQNQEFILIMMFGESLMQIYTWPSENRMVKFIRNQISLEKERLGMRTAIPNCAIAESISTLMIMPPTNDSKFYLSLNYIMNSVRFENQSDQLIRGKDDIVNTILIGKDKNDLMRLHVSEYCFMLLNRSILNGIEQQFEETRSPILKNYEGHVKKFLSVHQNFMDLIEAHNVEANASQDRHSAITSHDYMNFIGKYYEKLSTGYELTYETLIMGWLLDHMLNPDHEVFTLSVNGKLPDEEELLDFSAVLGGALKIIDSCLEAFKGTLNGSGNMAIVRATSILHGNLFKQSLCIARHVSKDINLELIQDYDTKSTLGAHMEIAAVEAERRGNPNELRILKKIQVNKCEKTNKDGLRTCDCKNYIQSENRFDLSCMNCRHIHREFKSYGDLIGLPCLLILVNKGRMGDTFPESLVALDDRANHVTDLKDGMEPWLTTFAQEKGRMCRYTTRNSRLPILYLSQKLNTEIENNLAHDCTFYSYFIKRKAIDSMVTYDDKNFILKPKERHIDSIKDDKERNNHFLLTAEPQCGKTGVYLHLISLLREEIEGSAIEIDVESEDDDEEEEFDQSFESNSETKEFRDMVPYWHRLRKMKMPTTVSHRSKYHRWTGSYTYPVKNPPYFVGAFSKKTRKQTIMQQSSDMSNFKTQKSNHSGECCSFEVTQEEITKSDKFILSLCKEENITCSFPRLRQYQDLFHKHSVSDSMICLMTPSHGKAATARLNWNHLFMDENQLVKPFIHLVFVRKTEYAQYKQVWGNHLGIVQIPNEMKDCVSTVDNGGVGYARRFIQRFCYYLNIDCFYMCDDEIIYIQRVPMQQNLSMPQLHDYFTKIGSDVEQVPEALEYKRHPNFNPDSITIDSYSGPRNDFAIIGVKKRNKFSNSATQPYSKKHCSSLFWMNNKVLMEKKILFRPWMAWEDLTLCNDADAKGLHVVKMNSFELTKVASRDTTLLYEWQDIDFNIHESENRSEVSKVHGSLLRHLKSIKIKRVACDEDNHGIPIFEKIKNLKVAKKGGYSVILCSNFPSYEVYDVENMHNILILPLTDGIYCDYRSKDDLLSKFPPNLSELNVFSTHKPRIENDFWILHAVFRKQSTSRHENAALVTNSSSEEDFQSEVIRRFKSMEKFNQDHFRMTQRNNRMLNELLSKVLQDDPKNKKKKSNGPTQQVISQFLVSNSQNLSQDRSSAIDNPTLPAPTGLPRSEENQTALQLMKLSKSALEELGVSEGINRASLKRKSKHDIVDEILKKRNKQK